MAPAGIVAHSMPRKAQSVSVAVAVTPPAAARMPPAGKGKCDGCSTTIPAIPMTMSGRILRAVVTNCTRAAACRPQMFTAVSSHTIVRAMIAADAGARTSEGMNGSR